MKYMQCRCPNLGAEQLVVATVQKEDFYLLKIFNLFNDLKLFDYLK